MALDGIVINKINEKLQTILPVRITKINNISDTELLFQIKNNSERFSLLISCHSQFNRINLTDKKYPVPNEPSNFVMLLRKHLENGMLIKIQQGNLDRYLTFTILTHNEIGDPITRYLFVELMGKYANVILTDENLKIFDALKRIPPFENSQRTIQPGAVFTLPKDQGKSDPFTSQTYDPNISFTEQFGGFSPLLSREFEYRIMQNESFDDLINKLHTSDHLYITNYQNKFYFHLIELTQFETISKKLPIMTALDELYFYQEEVDRIRQKTGDLFKFVRNELKKNQQKYQKLTLSMNEALDCSKWQKYGDLLFAYQHMIKKGDEVACLNDFETNELITIPLDPKLDVKQNAKKYFQKYNKGKKGQIHIQQQLDICQNEIDYFMMIQKQLEMIDFKDALEIKEELISNGYLRSSVKSKRPKKISLNYLTIKYDENTFIYVGKNNRQNEFVTFKLANKNDYWFHALDYHGSHTIINTDDLDEPKIRLAAMLAAYYSSASESSSIPIAYTKVKNLKKIPNSKAGLVTMSSYQTIYIDIDHNLLRQYITMKEFV